jgi:hypothetical protein
LPSFDWNAALIVGAIVAIGAVVVIAVAIATPVIAIQGGATLIGTTLAVAGIGLVTGTVAGGAAGFYWGREGDLKRAEILEQVMKVSNQLDIYFEPLSGDPQMARNLSCTIVTYEEQGLDTKAPGVNVKKQQIKALNADDFFTEAEAKVQDWIARHKGAGRDGGPRLRVQFFMKPYPGETFYERLQPFCAQRGCVISRTDGTWTSALDR